MHFMDECLKIQKSSEYSEIGYLFSVSVLGIGGSEVA